MSLDDLPVSLRLAWWGTAWLRGLVGPDDLIDAVLGGAVTHVVLSTDHSGPDRPGEALLPVLAAARARGADAVAATFPAPGDPVGLVGPVVLTGAAIEAGEAALLLGADTALVPRVVGHAVEWTSYRAERRPPPDLGEADRLLRGALLRAADGLAELDVASWRPEVADELHDLRTGMPAPAAPGVPDRCVDLAGRALHLEAVLDLALADDGGALSSGEIERRRVALAPLSAAVRRALTAACSPDGWPPPLISSR